MEAKRRLPNPHRRGAARKSPSSPRDRSSWGSLERGPGPEGWPRARRFLGSARGRPAPRAAGGAPSACRLRRSVAVACGSGGPAGPRRPGPGQPRAASPRRAVKEPGRVEGRAGCGPGRAGSGGGFRGGDHHRGGRGRRGSRQGRGLEHGQALPHGRLAGGVGHGVHTQGDDEHAVVGDQPFPANRRLDDLGNVDLRSHRPPAFLGPGRRGHVFHQLHLMDRRNPGILARDLGEHALVACARRWSRAGPPGPSRIRGRRPPRPHDRPGRPRGGSSRKQPCGRRRGT